MMGLCMWMFVYGACHIAVIAYTNVFLCVVCDIRQGITFVQCTQVHAAGWSSRSNANAGRLPATVYNYAEVVISV